MRDSLYNPFMPTKPQVVYGGGGGGGAPAPVQPTVNTDTVQQANVGANHVGGTSGGKAGSNPFESTPVQQPNQIQFGGYGQQSPFGLTNPQTWGTNLSQNVSATPVQNNFSDSAFVQQRQAQPVGGSSDSGLSVGQSVPMQEGSVLSQEEYAAADPDTQAHSMLNTTGEGAQAGGFISGITGKGDDWGSSLSTGAQSNVGLQDRAIALGETVGGFSPIVGGVTGAVADRVAPKNQFQKDNRTAQEVSIDRHTKRWQDSNNDDGPSMTHQEILDKHALQRNKDLGYSSTPSQSAAAAGFDMNDPSTWLQEEDKVNLKSKGTSQSSNDDSGSSSGSSGGK